MAGILPVRRLMFIGTQEHGDGDVGSDYMDIIYRSGEEKEIVEVILTTAHEQDICDEMYFSKMIASTETFKILGEESEKLGFLTQITNEYVSPYITLPPTWDAYLNKLTSSMRYKIKNEKRKCAKLELINISKADNERSLALFFSELVSLHNKRWQAKGLAGAFMNDQFFSFHRGILPRLLESGKLELVRITENGDTRAVLYNIFYGKKIYFYQSGIDTYETKAAFGYLLHSYCIEDAINRGLHEYDFLPKGGTDKYKDRFANASRIVADLYIARSLPVKCIRKMLDSVRSAYQPFKKYIKPAKEFSAYRSGVAVYPKSNLEIDSAKQS